MGTKKIVLVDLQSGERANQVVWDVKDDPMTARTIVARAAAEHIVGRIPEGILPEMVEMSCSKPSANAFTNEPNVSLYEEQVDGKELVPARYSDTKDQETTAAEENRRSEFHNLSVDRNGVQVIVTTNPNTIYAEDIHCGENGGQIAGQGSGEALLRMWKALHNPPRSQKVNEETAPRRGDRYTETGASR
jgi:hypothetical protein